MSSRIIAVTGASGFTGGHCVEELLKHPQRFTVRCTVRDVNNTQFLRKLAEKHNASDRISFFCASFEKAGSFDAAFAGAEAVLHVAAVTEISFKTDPLAEIVMPGVAGAREVGMAATRSGTVRRIVLTASGSLVDQFDRERLPQHRGNAFVEEEEKYDLRPHRVPYVLEKVLSEKAIAEAFGGTVISLLPTLIIGPQQNSMVRSSQNLLKALLLRETPYAPRFFASWIDVRDVAAAHVAALDVDAAAHMAPNTNIRRYIISSSEVISCADIAKSINRQQKIGAPEVLMPHWLLWVASFFDERVTEYLRLDLSEPRSGMDTARATKELKFQRRYTDLDETIRDAVESFKEHRIIKK